MHRSVFISRVGRAGVDGAVVVDEEEEEDVVTVKLKSWGAGSATVNEGKEEKIRVKNRREIGTGIRD